MEQNRFNLIISALQRLIRHRGDIKHDESTIVAANSSGNINSNDIFVIFCSLVNIKSCIARYRVMERYCLEFC